MTIDVDTNTLATVIIAGFAAHSAVLKWIIDGAVAKFGKQVAEDYATKEDLVNHVETLHK